VAIDLSGLRPTCPYCRGPVGVEARKAACDACLAWHHRECWREHGACTACGSERPPLTTPNAAGLLEEEVLAVAEELRVGNPEAAQDLCRELRGDEDSARELYLEALGRARSEGWIETARQLNARVIELLAGGEVENAQTLCLSVAEGDEERARELYEYLLREAREGGAL
jgi:hypothetical protein